MKGGGKEIIMKKANDFLRDLKFYPCEDPYTKIVLSGSNYIKWLFLFCLFSKGR